jgi:2-dehydro-3-deoxyphosphooctonate aldolase (KDO 8-P synthase)
LKKKQADNQVQVGSHKIGGGEPLAILAGPCVLEDLDHAIRHAEAIGEICDRLSLPFVFKASFDKANRTSLDAYRGPGMKQGLEWLAEIKERTGRSVVTDIHEASQAEPVAEVVDLLQIPAFLCRQTDLLVAAAQTGKPVNIKKGQFLSPADMRHPLRKVVESGNAQVLLTERGTSFGYNRLVVDFTGLVEMREWGTPIVFDATHAVQRPGGAGGSTSGDRKMVPPLARAAVAVGVDALFLEVHENPDKAPSDGPNMLRLADLEGLLLDLI